MKGVYVRIIEAAIPVECMRQGVHNISLSTTTSPIVQAALNCIPNSYSLTVPGYFRFNYSPQKNVQENLEMNILYGGKSMCGITIPLEIFPIRAIARISFQFNAFSKMYKGSRATIEVHYSDVQCQPFNAPYAPISQTTNYVKKTFIDLPGVTIEIGKRNVEGVAVIPACNQMPMQQQQIPAYHAPQGYNQYPGQPRPQQMMPNPQQMQQRPTMPQQPQKYQYPQPVPQQKPMTPQPNQAQMAAQQGPTTPKQTQTTSQAQQQIPTITIKDQQPQQVPKIPILPKYPSNYHPIKPQQQPAEPKPKEEKPASKQQFQVPDGYAPTEYPYIAPILDTPIVAYPKLDSITK